MFDPGEGDSPAAIGVIVTCATGGAVIRYTLDGSEPTTSSPSVSSGGSVNVSRSLTLKAKAWNGSESSATTTAAYRLTGDVAPGYHHVLSIDYEGNVYAWGEQASGRLGNGLTGTANVATPGPAKYPSTAAINDAIAIAGGQNHSLFVKSDRSVWSFGNNASGELGDTTTSNRSFAVRVCKSSSSTDYLNGCISVSGGNDFSGAFGADGKVYMWGSQGGGRLGNDSTLGRMALG